LELEERWRRKYRIELETERFRLRPLRDEDVDWINGLCMDPDVNRFLWECCTSVEKARRTAEAIVYLDLNKYHFGHWAIQDKQTGVIHGWTELGKLRPWCGPSDEIALSYVLRRASWGQGIATEAAGRLLQHGLEVNELDRVMAVIMAANAASRRVLEKLGMRPIQTATSHDGKDLQYFIIEAPHTSQ